MLIRFFILYICLFGAFASCAPAPDGELLWKFEAKKSHRQWADFDEQRFYLCADDVYCLERDTGRLLWEFETFGGHSSAPVISGERLFFQCGGLYALDAETGDVLWEFWTKNWATISPAVDAWRVYAPVGDRLYCADVATGKRLWSVKTGPLEKAPVLIGKRLFLNRGEKIFCLDASSGKLLWRFEAGSDRIQLAAAGNYLLSTGSAGLVRAHRIETGKVQWQRNTNMPLVSLCVLSGGRVLISAGGLYCLDLESGVSLWTFKQDQVFVFDAQGLGDYVFARATKLGFFCVSMHDGSLIRRLRLPDGGRLLTDKKDAIFFNGGQSRKVSSFSVPLL